MVEMSTQLSGEIRQAGTQNVFDQLDFSSKHAQCCTTVPIYEVTVLKRRKRKRGRKRRLCGCEVVIVKE